MAVASGDVAVRARPQQEALRFVRHRWVDVDVRVQVRLRGRVGVAGQRRQPDNAGGPTAVGPVLPDVGNVAAVGLAAVTISPVKISAVKAGELRGGPVAAGAVPDVVVQRVAQSAVPPRWTGGAGEGEFGRPAGLLKHPHTDIAGDMHQRHDRGARRNHHLAQDAAPVQLHVPGVRVRVASGLPTHDRVRVVTPDPDRRRVRDQPDPG
jgi:hypothetical protein